ncbi:L-lactate dehydrogenase [Williamsoniiplasma luminosum]|uniref:L-lactate dehydrogenase n=1 Tax=Williamsoniiplasma luminosum TaxID=214888 RepID=A0A2S0NJE3_9MOLU|nr:L-lactate dehydrogenase [Williamsoniiplasma luminosum]AVP49122.1 MAG: L-lactate dehydrogenase [Williamsoniiplasma luminosum]
MKKTPNKVVLIGAGAVGTSFLYAAINQGLASDYVLIDAFPQAAEGNAIDLSDTMSVLPFPATTIKAGDYADCKDADIIVITAGRPQKPGETRLDMVAGNAVIMKTIAEEILKSGFDGITIIASNPVDVLTSVYQEVTGFDQNKVIGSGTTLDSARLKRLIADKLNVGAQSVDAYLAGEHGDSAVAVWSHAVVMGQPISKYIKDGKITQKELDEIRDQAVHMGYKIIELKRATFYGIGAVLTRMCRVILRDEKEALMVGAKLNGEYHNDDVYTGVPAIIGANGIEQIIEWKLTQVEQKQFDASVATLKATLVKAREAIK